MTIEELKIGNYFISRNNIKIVQSIEFNPSDFEYTIFCALGSEFFLEDLIGVDLTEDWLLKFGFGKDNGFGGSWLSPEDEYGGRLRILLAVNKKTFLWQYSMFGNVKINFVHQLQNLYFALTQKELTI